MTTEITNVEVSSESEFDLKLEDGMMKMLVSYEGKGANAGLYVDVKPEYFLEKLKKAIPGELDDKVIDMLAVALKIS